VAQSRVADIGNVGLSFTNQGYFGNLLNPALQTPSFEYPLNSNVEHMFVGGIWVGAIDAQGRKRVSAGADDTSGGSASPVQEFGPAPPDTVRFISTNPLSRYFSSDALADEHYEFVSYDRLGGGYTGSDSSLFHVPMGVAVQTKVLAYSPPYADDFVILDFTVLNEGDQELQDMYLGFYNELSVGNTKVTIPGDDTNGWNFYDDKNGFIGPGELPDDVDARIMHCHDADGEDGRAPSWAGLRILGSDIEPEVLSYRQWPFGDEQRRTDEGKYDFLSSGRIDRGNDGSVNYDAERNWSSMIAIGPWELLLPGDTANFTVAFVAGLDSVQMVRNSQVAQSIYDSGFQLPSGPPSPRLEVATRSNGVVLRWNPGTAPAPEDTVLNRAESQPEFHRSEFTREYDFQGYRIYRIDGEEIGGDPFEQASLLAEFDRTEWPDGSHDPWGFNLGLPPLVDGMREFVDTGVRDGFPYWYAVTSYTNRNPRLGLEELESGFNENAALIIPGSAPGGTPTNREPVGVYPNPYRGSGYFDDRRPTGEPAELGRQIWFTNVPARARILIYNVSGTLVDQLRHDDAGTGQVAWNMLSESTRALAPGLYVYVVEDLDSGEVQRGKLVILK
jgi:hypothetical protein